MSRNTGTFNFAANFEGLLKAPIDARQIVGTYADLINPATWNASGNVWLYDGAIVAVSNDSTPSLNGVYFLSNSANYTSTSSWVKVGFGSGTLTGATNGLIVTGVNVGLGGTLTGNTTINGGGFNLNLSNFKNFQVSTSGTSVNFDETQGFVYGGNYSSSNDYWIPTKFYVDGVAIGLNVHPAAWVATTSSITLSGLTTVDGILLQNGMRVLVKNQNNTFSGDSANGIYIATGTTWQRADDYNFTPSGEISNGDLIPVTSGVTQYNSLWSVTSPNPIVSGDSIQFTLFSMPTKFLAGTGINININTISVDGAVLAGNSIVWSGNTFNVDVNSGGLLTALNNKLNKSIFVSYTGATNTRLNTDEANITWISGQTVTNTRFNTYTGATQPIIIRAITGVTNVGGGTSIYSGTSGHNFVLDTIVGSGLTKVQKVGNNIIISSSGASGGGNYVGESPSAVNLCGISIGYVLTGKTVSCIIQDLLVPELFQSSVGTPSTSVGGTFTGTLEIGCSISQTITPTYTAGAVTPPYCSTSPFTRGGAANDYSYSGPSVSTGFLGCTSCVINPYVVTSGSQTWSVCTKYDAGSCIKGSKGTVNPTYPTICPLNSCTPTGSASITGILPWYWGTSASGVISGANVAAGTKTIAVVGSSTPITYNASAQFLWFAAPIGTFTAKTKWWVCAANAGNIGGTGELWAAACTVAVTSAQGCWAACNYSVYVTCGITTTAAGVSMCLYF